MIPRVFHRMWVGGPMPEHLEAYGDTWKTHHPDWEFRFWTDDNLPVLRNQRIYAAADSIAPANVGQLRADIARYELLLDLGGVWIDCDLECLRPIDGLLAGVECFAGWEVPNQWVNNAILGAEPGHPFIFDLVHGLPANVRRKMGARPNKLSGPGFVTPVYRRHAKRVTVFAKDHFYPYLHNELDRQGEVFPNSYAVHHWNNARRKAVSA